MNTVNVSFAALGISLSFGVFACGSAGGATQAESTRSTSQGVTAGTQGPMLVLTQEKATIEGQMVVVTQSIQALTDQEQELAQSGQSVTRTESAIEGLEAQMATLQSQLALINEEIAAQQALQQNNMKNEFGI